MLSQFLATELYSFLLIFCRVGTAFMLLPGFGEAYVLSRARMFIALMFSLLLVPILHNVPPMPRETFTLMTLIIAEILTGAFIGGMARMLITAMHLAGGIIAYQSSLSSALTTDLLQGGGQDTSLSNLLSVSAVLMIFALNLHHLMLQSLVDSYNIFLPGHFPIVQDIANLATTTITGAFRMSMQLAAPHIVVGLMIYLSAGIIARLMPNIQIFFIILPLQLMLSFLILMVVISSILLWYSEYFKQALSVLLT
ncbi:MAG: flagellar biosynthetic protein FliR [Rickettsiales bacterium]|nr:flagellar biosynthetic protein FliR [Rickettsiales bacterium]